MSFSPRAVQDDDSQMSTCEGALLLSSISPRVPSKEQGAKVHAYDSLISSAALDRTQDQQAKSTSQEEHQQELQLDLVNKQLHIKTKQDGVKYAHPRLFSPNV